MSARSKPKLEGEAPAEPEHDGSELLLSKGWTDARLGAGQASDGELEGPRVVYSRLPRMEQTQHPARSGQKKHLLVINLNAVEERACAKNSVSIRRGLW